MIILKKQKLLKKRIKKICCVIFEPIQGCLPLVITFNTLSY